MPATSNRQPRGAAPAVIRSRIGCEGQDRMPTFSINIDRLERDIENLASFTRGTGPGVTRLTFSEEDRAARAYVRGEMEASGLRVVEFPPGVMIGRLEPKTAIAPAVMAGSH